MRRYSSIALVHSEPSSINGDRETGIAHSRLRGTSYTVSYETADGESNLLFIFLYHPPPVSAKYVHPLASRHCAEWFLPLYLAWDGYIWYDLDLLCMTPPCSPFFTLVRSDRMTTCILHSDLQIQLQNGNICMCSGVELYQVCSLKRYDIERRLIYLVVLTFGQIWNSK